MRLIALLAGFSFLLGSCAAPKQSDPAAPESFRVNFDTSRGPVVAEVTTSQAPLGAARFYSLVKAKFFDGARFFRVVPGFVVQFGIAADPSVTKTWDRAIQDDPVKSSNSRGTLTFATSGPNTRTTQLFINLGDNQRLDGQGFSPFGKVVSGMDIVDRIYSGAAEGPDQHRIEQEGNSYLEKAFPNLDYIKTARIAQ